MACLEVWYQRLITLPQVQLQQYTHKAIHPFSLNQLAKTTSNVNIIRLQLTPPCLGTEWCCGCWWGWWCSADLRIGQSELASIVSSMQIQGDMQWPILHLQILRRDHLNHTPWRVGTVDWLQRRLGGFTLLDLKQTKSHWTILLVRFGLYDHHFHEDHTHNTLYLGGITRTVSKVPTVPTQGMQLEMYVV